LWDWAVAAYARPGVSDACVRLQDEQNENVPLLLFAAWCAASGRALDADRIEAACDTARAWEELAAKPLRAVRRTLKTRHPDLDDARRERVRELVKAAELDAERALLEDLAELAPAPSGAPRPVAPAMIEAAKAWTRVVPRGQLESLAALLPASL
jgi:uncharacterized protein (TIGR02444 family)